MLLKLLLIALPAFAAGPRCREGERPRFNGQPFRIYACEAPSAASAAAFPIPAPALPDPKPSGAADLKSLAGTWKGLAMFAGQRYEIKLVVEKKGRGVQAHWTAEDYRMHDKKELTGRLTPLFFQKGHLRGSAQAEYFEPVVVEAWAGKPTTGDATGFDREFVWVYEGLPDRHRVLFTRAGEDRVTFRYVGLSPRTPNGVGCSGELTRER